MMDTLWNERDHAALLEDPRYAGLLEDPRYAADKRIRDAAWDEWREERRRQGLREAGLSPEMQALVDEGYFARVASGDTRAASLFARLVALKMNPTARQTLPGWLAKGGGHNVDGFAEDAIVLNANPSDLFNVVDLVSGAGAPGASPVWNGPLPRRASDVWAPPQALSAPDLNYLKPGGVVEPGGPPQPKPTCPDPKAHQPKIYFGDPVFDSVGAALLEDYAAAGHLPNAGIGRWFGRTIWDATAGDETGRVLTIEDSIKKHRNEWRAALGLPLR